MRRRPQPDPPGEQIPERLRRFRPGEWPTHHADPLCCCHYLAAVTAWNEAHPDGPTVDDLPDARWVCVKDTI